MAEYRTCRHCKQVFQIVHDDFEAGDSLKQFPEIYCPSCNMNWNGNQKGKWIEKDDYYTDPESEAGGSK